MAVAALLVLVGATWSSTGDRTARGAGGPLRVVSTTEVIADVVSAVGGERVRSEPLVPHGGDPHSYEPRAEDARRIARADVTFTNHLLLEEQALVRAVDANARPGTPNVSLAETAESYGAHVRPLVEDLGLDVIWLGLRVRGAGRARGATRSSQVELEATRVRGPGRLVAYLTDALGQPERYFDSGDGLDERDVARLPPGAHTHLNWAFTRPGVYRLTLAARLRAAAGRRPQPLGRATFTFAVGTKPPRARGREVLDDGHTDLTVNLDRGGLYAFSAVGDPSKRQELEIAPADAVIAVPDRAREVVPRDPAFRFLGRPGARVFQLPQAVLGKHVHGEIDPHLWQDVANVKAYAQVVRDTLTRVDPAGRDAYARNTRRYLRELEELDGHVREQLRTIPREGRQLVTTHDAFAYLADAYGLKVAGFVVPNPAQEPSADQVRELAETIATLDVPAVFVEPNLAERAGVLRQVARDLGVRVCKLYGDGFDHRARSYVAMMRHNAGELRRCLGGPR